MSDIVRLVDSNFDLSLPKNTQKHIKSCHKIQKRCAMLYKINLQKIIYQNIKKSFNIVHKNLKMHEIYSHMWFISVKGQRNQYFEFCSHAFQGLIMPNQFGSALLASLSPKEMIWIHPRKFGFNSISDATEG